MKIKSTMTILLIFLSLAGLGVTQNGVIFLLSGEVDLLTDGPNLLRNGDFNFPTIEKGNTYQYFGSSLESGWKGGNILYYWGSMINSGWTASQVLVMDRVNNTNWVSYDVGLLKGRYLLKLNFAANPQSITACKFEVLWAGKILNTYETNATNIFYTELIIPITADDTYTLRINQLNGGVEQGVGCSYDNFDLRHLIEPPRYGNVIQNSKFQVPTLLSGQNSRIYPRSIWGWRATKIEIFKGIAFNLGFLTKQLLSILPTVQMAVQQKVVLVDSIYVLRFDCGAKSTLEGNTDITVVFNSVTIATIIVDNKKIMRKYFTLQAIVGNNFLKFYSTAGIGLDNVDLRDIIEYPDMPSIQNGDFMLPSLGGTAQKVFSGVGEVPSWTYKTMTLSKPANFNTQWSNPDQVSVMNFLKTDIYSQDVNLPPGIYFLGMYYGPRKNFAGRPGINMLWNSNVVAQLPNYFFDMTSQPRTTPIPPLPRIAYFVVECLTESNKVGLQSDSTVGPNGEMGASQVNIKTTIDRADGGNRLVNGEFAVTALGPSETFRITPNKIFGWKGKSIEVAKGTSLNTNWKDPEQQVLVAKQSPDSVCQVFYVPSGAFILRFMWGKNKNTLASTKSTLNMQINELPVQAFTTTIDALRREYYGYESSDGKNTVCFWGTGAPTVSNIDTRLFTDYSQTPNQQKNGDFELPQLAVGETIKRFKDQIPGWKGKEITLGKGNIFNSQWGDTQVCKLNSDKTDSLTSTLPMKEGLYVVSFDWAAGFSAAGRSGMKVNWNGVQVGRYESIDDRIYTVYTIVKATTGDNLLQYVSTFESDTFGMTIDNVNVRQLAEVINPQTLVKPENGITVGANMVQNGDFEKPVCKAITRFTAANPVPNWITTTEDIGIGWYFNSKWGNTTQVLSLDPTPNNNFTQIIDLFQRQYLLTFDYAPGVGGSMRARFRVFLNGDLVVQLGALNYDVIRYYQVVKGQLGSNTLVFQSFNNFGYPMTIDNVNLKIFKRVKSGGLDPLQPSQYNPDMVADNIIQNGRFQTPKIPITTPPTKTVVYDSIPFWTNPVTGGKIELDQAKLMNSIWPTTSQAAELDSSVTTIKQSFISDGRNFLVRFMWGPKMTASSKSGVSLTVTINTVVVGMLAHKGTYTPVTQSFVFYVPLGPASITFTISSTLPAYGILVDNVELYRLREEAENDLDPSKGVIGTTQLIQNGNFAVPPVTVISTVDPLVAKWIGSAVITFAPGLLVNFKWGPTTQVCLLGKSNTDSISQIFQGTARSHVLIYDWAPMTGLDGTSKLFVTVNLDNIDQAKSLSSKTDVMREYVVFDANYGDNTIKFTTINSYGFGLSISQVMVRTFTKSLTAVTLEKPSQGVADTAVDNFITNGRFMVPVIPTGQQFLVTAGTILGWAPTNQIKQFLGPNYNPKYVVSKEPQVLQLPIAKNIPQTAQQVLDMDLGPYFLMVRWAAPTGKPNSGAVQVLWNTNLRALLYPADDEPHNDIIYVVAVNGSNTLRFVQEMTVPTATLSVASVALRRTTASVNRDPKNYVSYGTNLAKNGDFAQPPVTKPTSFTAAGAVPFWNAPNIQIGKGYNYNTNWGFTQQVAHLSTNPSDSISQTIPSMSPRRVLVRFDCAMDATATGTPTVVPLWNGKPIGGVVFEKGNQNIRTGYCITDALPGDNTISFSMANVTSLSATLSNVQVFYTTPNPAGTQTPLPNTPNTLINTVLEEIAVDGDFKQITFPAGVNNAPFPDGSVPGWKPLMTIWKGDAFNPGFPVGSNVASLDSIPNKKEYIEQISKLQNRSYIVTYDYAARITDPAQPLTTYAFAIKWNGKVVATVNPQDTKVQTESFIVVGIDGDNALRFQELGADDGFGAGITNVSIERVDSEPTIQPNQGVIGSDNLLSNGGFQDPKIDVFSKMFTKEGDVPGWTGFPINLMRGYIANPNWGQTTQVCILSTDPAVKLAHTAITSLGAIRYVLILDYAPQVPGLQDSGFRMTWNNRPVGQLRSGGKGDVKRSYFVVESSTGQNNLIFIGSGYGQVGMSIDNVELKTFRFTPTQNSTLLDAPQQNVITVGQNLIYNGQFEEPVVPTSDPFKDYPSIPNWFAASSTGLIQLGKGTGFNPNWVTATGQVTALNANTAAAPDSISQKLLLFAIPYVMSFEYALSTRTSSALEGQGFYLVWNTKEFGTYVMADVKVNVAKAVLMGVAGENVLTFRQFSSARPRSITLDNVVLLGIEGQLPDPEQGDATGPNYIKNGDFEVPVVTTKEAFTPQKPLPLWNVVATAEVGKGYLYNVGWGITQVCRPDPAGTLINQVINLRQGQYLLQFDYSVQAGHLGVGLLNVWWNTFKTSMITPADEQLRLFKVVMMGMEGSNTLGFSLSGDPSLVSIEIDNLILRSFIPSAKSSISKVKSGSGVFTPAESEDQKSAIDSKGIKRGPNGYFLGDFSIDSGDYAYDLSDDFSAPVVPEYKPTDIAVNGNFGDPKLPAGTNSKQYSSVPGWTSPRPILIGNGPFFNPNWPAGQQIALLDKDHDPITQYLKMNDALYEINFEMAGINAAQGGPHVLKILFNGVSAGQYTLTTDDIAKRKLIVTGKKGMNALTFTVATSRTTPVVGITNVRARQIVMRTPYFNQVLNEDFRTPRLTKPVEDFTAVPNWVATTFKLAKGAHFNSAWPQWFQVCVVSEPVIQELPLNDALYVAKFSWSRQTIVPSSETVGVTFYWNGQRIVDLNTPGNDLKVEYFPVMGKIGFNYLAFAATSKFPVLVSRVDVRRYAEYVRTTNLVVNPLFADPQLLTADPPSKVYSASIPGWKGTKITLWKAPSFNPKWAIGTQLAELTTNAAAPDALTQAISIPNSEKYFLTFKASARDAKPFTNSVFVISFNDLTLATITPTNYDINFYAYAVKAVADVNNLKFVSKGNADNIGAGISEVYLRMIALRRLDEGNRIYNGQFMNPLIDPKVGTVTFNEEIDGWRSSTIQLVSGQFMNNNWPINSQQCLASSVPNQPLTQSVTIKKDTHILAFDWSSKGGQNPASIKLAFSGKSLASLTSTDSFIRRSFNLFYSQEVIGDVVFTADPNSALLSQVTLNRIGDYAKLLNQITNGDFALPKITSGKTASYGPQSAVPGWTGTPVHKVDIGFQFNTVWPQGLQVSEMDANNKNLDLIQSVNLMAGTYLLSFQYAPNVAKIQSCGVRVMWNTVQVAAHVAKSNFMETSYTIVTASQGLNTLLFKGTEAEDSIGMLIGNVQIMWLYLRPEQGNQIFNGEFKPILGSISKPSETFTGGIVGWSGTTVKIFKASQFNSRWSPSQYLAELDGTDTSKITQELPLLPGRSYVVRFAWSGSSLPAFSSQTFYDITVSLNGKLISSFNSNSLDIQRSFAVFDASPMNSVTFSSANRCGVSNVDIRETEQYLRGSNMVENPLFANPSLQGLESKVFSNFQGIPSWSAKTITLFQGTRYNTNWLTGQVALPGIALEDTLTQYVVCPIGVYLLSFKFSVYNGDGSLKGDSSIKAMWNGEELMTFGPKDNAIYNKNIAVKAFEGANVLAFQSVQVGASTAVMSVGELTLYNIYLEPTELVPLIETTGDNLITNGYFSDPAIPAAQTKSSYTSGIPGWMAPKITLSDGFTYNMRWGIKNQVCLLDMTENTYIEQTIPNLFHGAYVLIFMWANPNVLPAATGQITTIWNGSPLASVQSNDIAVRKTEQLIFGKKGRNTLKFSAVKGAVGTGLSIDNVSLKWVVGSDKFLPIMPLGQIPSNLYSDMNLIINGNFKTEVPGTYKNKITGWTGPNIVLASGPTVNPNWEANSQVVNLQNGAGDLVRQNLTLTASWFWLKFSYAAVPNTVRSSLRCFWGNYEVGTFSPSVDKVFKVELAVRADDGMTDLFCESLCDTGKGVTLTNVQLYQLPPGYTLNRFVVNPKPQPTYQ